MRILITGGTGLIGRSLSMLLEKRGYEVNILSRDSRKGFLWDYKRSYLDPNALEGVDSIIHLAGENIGGGRWSSKRKSEIFESRVESSRFLLSEIKGRGIRLKSFITASAIGLYGAVTRDKPFVETDPYHNDFLGSTCKEWEDATQKFNEVSERVVTIRTGVVLSKNGGALEKMILPVKWSFGTPIGSGDQYIPWISLRDIVGIYLKAVEDLNITGIYNGVSPNYITNREFMRIVSKIIKRPFINFGVPSLLLKIVLGEMSDLVLKGSPVSSQKIVDGGYQFMDSDLEKYLREEIG
jgi:uncharacterized protein (TIGR01777 family)